MTWTDFILSDKTSTKVKRHLTLWICFCIYFFGVNFFPQNWHDLIDSKAYVLAFQKLVYIPVSIFSVYISGYFLLPRFILKGKYFIFFMLMILLCCVNLVSAWLLTKFLIKQTTIVSFDKLSRAIKIYQPVIYGIGLGLAASGFAIIVKLLKYHYLKQKENERLQRQKINTELKIIKTNFHPHFLSDALKNISNLIRNSSKQSTKVILALSELLSYILYDSEKEDVLVTHEIQMIKEYLDLEKIFYPDKIIITLNESGNANDLKIAPLILLSLIQNTCGQLLISLQQKLILNIKIKTEDKRFFFELHCNGYYDTINGIANPTSALSNALRRIEILYGRKNIVKTKIENEFISIELVLEPGALSIKDETKSLYATA